MGAHLLHHLGCNPKGDDALQFKHRHRGHAWRQPAFILRPTHVARTQFALQVNAPDSVLPRGAQQIQSGHQQTRQQRQGTAGAHEHQGHHPSLQARPTALAGLEQPPQRRRNHAHTGDQQRPHQNRHRHPRQPQVAADTHGDHGQRVPLPSPQARFARVKERGERVRQAGRGWNHAQQRTAHPHPPLAPQHRPMRSALSVLNLQMLVIDQHLERVHHRHQQSQRCKLKTHPVDHQPPRRSPPVGHHGQHKNRLLGRHAQLDSGGPEQPRQGD